MASKRLSQAIKDAQRGNSLCTTSGFPAYGLGLPSIAIIFDFRQHHRNLGAQSETCK
jgi:hypothetical protein